MATKPPKQAVRTNINKIRDTWGTSFARVLFLLGEGKPGMKRRVILWILLPAIAVVGCIAFIIYSYFFTLSYVPRGKYLTSVESPNHSYRINVYRIEGPATVSDTVRGELVDERSGHKKNVYWGYKVSDAKVVWINNDVVSINGHKINIAKGQIYDWRHDDQN
jgi:hypothetical protein